jgi:hypothetical protein
MAWTAQHICVAGPDKKVVFYTQEGLLAQQFDYFRCNFYFILLEQAICGLGSKYEAHKNVDRRKCTSIFLFFIFFT